MPQELIDRFVTATRLVLLELDGFVDNLLLDATWFTAVAASPPEQGLEAPLPNQLPLSPKGRQAGLLALPIGKELFGLRQLAQKGGGLFTRNFFQNQRLQ